MKINMTWRKIITLGIFSFVLCVVIVLKVDRSANRGAVQYAGSSSKVSVAYGANQSVIRWTSPPVFISPPPEASPDMISASFSIRNRSRSQVLELTKKSSSCGCTTAMKNFESLPPEGVGDINVSVSTRYMLEENRLEAIEYQTNDSNVGRLRLEVAASCYPRIDIAPPKGIQTAPLNNKTIIRMPFSIYSPAEEIRENVAVNVRGEFTTVDQVIARSVTVHNGVCERAMEALISIAPESEMSSNVLETPSVSTVTVSTGKYKHSVDIVWKIGYPIVAQPGRLFYKISDSKEVLRRKIVLKSTEAFVINSVSLVEGFTVKYDDKLSHKEHSLEIELRPERIKYNSKKLRTEVLTIATSKSPVPFEYSVMILLP